MTVKIFLLQKVNRIDELYTYFVPSRLEDKIVPGVFVVVPFGAGERKETGVVAEAAYDDREQNIIIGNKTVKLKEIYAINEDYSPLTLNDLRLCEKIHNEYLCTRGQAARLMMPPDVNEKSETVKTVSLAIEKEEALKVIDSDKIRSIAQIRTLETLIEYGKITEGELMRITGAKSESFVKSLEKKGYVKIFREQEHSIENREKVIITGKKKTLNEEQKKAYVKISGLIDTKKFHEVLLFGVTSGGKTEVYLQLTEKVLNEGGKAVILVPEISLTPQMTARFTERFGTRVAVLHSRLSEGERKREWLRMKNGEADMVIGARSAVFAPFENVSLFIVDEEQERTYKSEETPRYHGGEVAAMRAKDQGATVVYGSATPSSETFYRAQTGQIEYVEILHRANNKELPKVSVVDMKEKNGITGEEIFSRELYNEMKKNLEASQQTLIFVPRRGYSRDLICSGCGKTMTCGKCNVAMTVHEKEGRLICHYCGNTVRIPSVCPGCGCGKMIRSGVGTERVEEELKKLFPGCKVVRMDSDTTARKNGHQEAIRRFKEEKADFLVGTQMIAKGHDFPLVTLVGVVSADALLNIKEYNAAEKAFQLIAQVCGRAGRGDVPGRVVIQAYNLDAYPLVYGVRQDYFAFYRGESEIRKVLNYPPYSSMGQLTFLSENDRKTFDTGVFAYKLLCEIVKKDGIMDAEVLGPARCPMPKIKDRYRWRITVKTKTRQDLLEILRKFEQKFRPVSEKTGVKYHTEV